MCSHYIIKVKVENWFLIPIKQFCAGAEKGTGIWRRNDRAENESQGASGVMGKHSPEAEAFSGCSRWNNTRIHVSWSGNITPARLNLPNSRHMKSEAERGAQQTVEPSSSEKNERRQKNTLPWWYVPLAFIHRTEFPLNFLLFSAPSWW